jgi:hypothetical protein
MTVSRSLDLPDRAWCCKTNGFHQDEEQHQLRY